MYDKVYNFRGRQALHEFQTAKDSENHTGIGLHLPLGNGEGSYLMEAKRDLANATSYVQNTANPSSAFSKPIHFCTCEEWLFWRDLHSHTAGSSMENYGHLISRHLTPMQHPTLLHLLDVDPEP